MSAAGRRAPVPPPAGEVRAIVERALAEDRAEYDVTTRALVDPALPGTGRFVFREGGVVCGIPVAQAVFERLSPAIVVEPLVAEGASVEAGTTVAVARGPIAPMLSGERVALNLVQRMSGVATMTAAFVRRAAEGGPARVVDTRKTTPGLRALERYAVRAGGGQNHRDHLQDGVMVKDNHLVAAGLAGASIAEAIAAVRARVPHTVKIEVEADRVEQALEAIAGGADVVLLDNMAPADMRRVVEAAPPHVVLEASGGVTLDTIREVAASGVHVISAGALTHSARALDVALDLEAGRPADLA